MKFSDRNPSSKLHVVLRAYWLTFVCVGGCRKCVNRGVKEIHKHTFTLSLLSLSLSPSYNRHERLINVVPFFDLCLCIPSCLYPLVNEFDMDVMHPTTRAPNSVKMSPSPSFFFLCCINQYPTVVSLN